MINPRTYKQTHTKPWNKGGGGGGPKDGGGGGGMDDQTFIKGV